MKKVTLLTSLLFCLPLFPVIAVEIVGSSALEIGLSKKENGLALTRIQLKGREFLKSKSQIRQITLTNASNIGHIVTSLDQSF